MFGLSLYCASLSQGQLKESGLASLFTHLSQHCIVLLEDIDSASMRRKNACGESDNADDQEPDPELDETVGKQKKSKLLQARLARILAKRKANTTKDDADAVIKALAGNT
jgi:chaperone BCS1